MKHRYLATSAAVALLAAYGAAHAQVQLKGESESGAQIQQQAPGQTQQPDQPPTVQGSPGQQPGQAQETEQRGGAAAGAEVQLTEEQRSQVRNIVVERQSELRTAADVNFTISVGATVPRTIELYPLPAYIVEVVPAYRGFLYIVVGGQLLIIHPTTYEIVMVLPA